MPTPNKNETKEEFISRCVSYVAKEKPEMERDQTLAYCFSLWEENSSAALRERIIKLYEESLNAVESGVV